MCRLHCVTALFSSYHYDVQLLNVVRALTYDLLNRIATMINKHSGLLSIPYPMILLRVLCFRGKFGQVMKCRRKDNGEIFAAKFVTCTGREDRWEGISKTNVMENQ